MAMQRETPPPPVPRVQAVLDELDRAAQEYTQTKAAWDVAQQRFVAAQKRLATIRRLAAEQLSTGEMYHWRVRNPEIEFAGMPIGDAIEAYLRDEAWASGSYAYEHHTDERPPTYWPWRTQEQIRDALERGGFRFRGAPAREVNAATLHLASVTKNPESSTNYTTFAIANHQEIYDFWFGSPESEGEDESATE